MQNPSLDSVASHLSQVHWHGHYLSSLCPFHNDSRPSFMVYPDWYECKTCHRRGKSLARLMQLIQHRQPAPTFSPGYKIAWDEVLPDVEQFAWDSYTTLKKYPDLRFYYDRRGVGDLIEVNLLGWWNGWYTVPFFSKDGHVNGLALRAGPSLEKSVSSKYIVPPGQVLPFVPDYRLLDTCKTIFVPFGVFDALALKALRLASVTWMGKNTYDDRFIEFLKPIRKSIIILPDLREEVEARKMCQRIGLRGQVVCLDYPEGIKDPDGFLEHNRPQDLLSQIAKYNRI